MDQASEAVLKLKPATFHYKNRDVKSDLTPEFGLIAEEVAKVNPDLVVRNRNDEIYSVRYDQVNAMLLNEFLKEHRPVGELKATLAQQQKQVEALAAALQKVSAQLEAGPDDPKGFRDAERPAEGADLYDFFDRVTDRAHILETGTDSYRFRRTLDQRKRTNGHA